MSILSGKIGPFIFPAGGTMSFITIYYNIVTSAYFNEPVNG